MLCQYKFKNQYSKLFRKPVKKCLLERNYFICYETNNI